MDVPSKSNSTKTLGFALLLFFLRKKKEKEPVNSN